MPASRLRLLVFSAGAVVAVAVVVAGFAIFSRTPRPPESEGQLSTSVGRLTKVLYSPDGAYLAAASATGQVVLWHTESKKSQTLQQLTKEPIVSLELSPDGFLAAGDAAGNFVGWQLGSDRTEKMTGLAAAVTCIAFGPAEANDLQLVLGLSNGTLVFVDESGLSKRPSEHRGGVKRAVYHPNGELLITAGAGGKLTWRNAKTRRRVESTQAHSSEISSLVFSPDARMIASGDWNGEVKVWDAESNKQKAAFHQPDAVSGIAWSSSGLVTGSWDGSLRIWSIETAKMVHRIDTGHVIHDVAVALDSATIATVSGRDRVEFWRISRR